MSETDSVYLPTEIIVKIAKIVYYAKTTPKQNRDLESQQRMYRFCLVSRQWYTAGIELLYRKPQLMGGNRFANFTRTICPPSRDKKPTLELGSMVESLWLDKLVHHSSNSTTARLLSRTHKSLVEFVAPRVSFSLNGLTALSKCHKLQNLVLTQVVSKIPFPRLKKAISNLTSLKRLHLPPQVSLTPTTFSDGKWPRSLTFMKIGGRIDDEVMRSFDWPLFIEELNLSGLRYKDTISLEHILLGPYLADTLKRLVISHHYPDDELGFTQAIYSLKKLYYLECPVDLLEPLGILDRPDMVGPSALNLTELTLLCSSEGSIFEEEPSFLADSMGEALKTNLSKVLYMRVPTSLTIDYRLDVEDDWKKMDDIVQSHLEDVDDAELDNLDLAHVGIVFYVS